MLRTVLVLFFIALLGAVMAAVEKKAAVQKKAAVKVAKNFEVDLAGIADYHPAILVETMEQAKNMNVLQAAKRAHHAAQAQARHAEGPNMGALRPKAAAAAATRAVGGNQLPQYFGSNAYVQPGRPYNYPYAGLTPLPPQMPLDLPYPPYVPYEVTF